MNAFRTTAIGSFPKPPDLLAARRKFARGAIRYDTLREAERTAVRYWMELQNTLGVTEAVDSEMDRGDMIAHFAQRLHGFAIGELVESFANFSYHRPICVGLVSRAVDPGFTVEVWREAQALSRESVKGMLTDPFTIAAWSWNEYYGHVDEHGYFREHRADFVRALIPFIREEAHALQDAGAEIIQIDCPGIATWPDEFDLLLESMRAVTAGLRTKIVCHICFADYDRLYPRLLELPVHQLLLELSQEASPFQHGVVRPRSAFDHFTAHPFTKELGLGIMDVHVDSVPSVEEIGGIVRRAREAGIAADRIVLTPDCGLKTRSVEVATAMLERTAEAARVL